MQAPPHRTQGATLIVSLLFVMLILAVVMSVTAQVTLSTRRSSADQQEVLAARYAAESGVALVQARLRAMQRLLNDAAIGPEYSNTVLARLSDLCGTPVALTAPTAEEVEICDLSNQDKGLANSQNRVSLFTLAVPARAYTDEKVRARGNSENERAAFWTALFSGKKGTKFKGQGKRGEQFETEFGLMPQRLTQQGSGYRLYFRVSGLTSEGQNGRSAQRLQARAVAGGADAEYHILIERPGYPYALFTNHHYQSPQAEASNSRINFTGRTIFSGPVHTNQNYLFEGSEVGGQSVFWDKVTSTGCPKDAIGTVNGKPDCTVPEKDRLYGAYFDSQAQRFVNKDEMVSSEETPVWGDNAPQFKGGVQWNAKYEPLPVNSQDQSKAARAGGLLLSGDVDELQLFRDEFQGQERQRVVYVQGDTRVELAYGEDGALTIRDPQGNWVPATRGPAGAIVPGVPQAAFNGVISVDRGGITNLNGGPDAAKAVPAGASIASFAGVTVAATGSVAITSSLKYTEPPCQGKNTVEKKAECNKLDAKNVLGVFVSGQGSNIDLVSPRSCPNGDGTCPNIGEDPDIHAMLMAGQGAVQVRGYDQGSPLGYVNLIGGVIEDYYGAFGRFNASGPTNGYGRNFVYDERMSNGFTSPYFATQKDWKLTLRNDRNADLPNDSRGVRLQGDSVSVGQGD